MEFERPIVAYTAETNVEAHMIVEMLLANGIPAYAVEDQSGASLWAFGTISQFHQPNVWIDEPTLEKASLLIQSFEEKKRQRRHPRQGSGEIEVRCEDCGHTAMFSDSLNGTTQECPRCRAYVDVGELPWEDDFGTPEECAS